MKWVLTYKSLYVQAVSFVVILSPYHLKIKNISERDVYFLYLRQVSITQTVGIDELLAHIAPCPTHGTIVRRDPELLYAQTSLECNGFGMSFGGLSKTANHGGLGSFTWTLYRLSEWSFVMAASDYLPSTTVRLDEYAGMIRGAQVALDHQFTDLIIVGDSRLVMQQVMGVIASKHCTLQVESARYEELEKIFIPYDTARYPLLPYDYQRIDHISTGRQTDKLLLMRSA